MISNEAKALVRLKELQAQINGMRLALTTACSTCEVASVVNLLKTINSGVADSINLLEQSEYDKEPDLVEPAKVEQSAAEVPEDGNYKESDMYKQIDALLDKSVENTMDLVKNPIENESSMTEEETEAALSLATLMNQMDEDSAKMLAAMPIDSLTVKETIQEAQAVVESPIKKSSLSQQPIHFESPEIDPKEFNNGRESD